MKKLLIIFYSILTLAINCSEMSVTEKLAQIRLKKPNTHEYEFKELISLKHYAPINTVTWSNDDSLLASGSDDGIIKIWNKAGKLLQEIDLIQENDKNNAVKCLKWSSNNQFLAVGCINSIIIINLKQNEFYLNKVKHYAWGIEKILEGFNGFTYALAWSEDNSQLASSYNDKILIWDIKSGKKIQKFKLPKPIRSITWSDDSLTLGLISIIDGIIGTLDIKTGKPNIYKPNVNKNDYLISTKPCSKGISNSVIMLYYYEQDYIIKALSENYSKDLRSIAHTSNEHFLAAAYYDGTLKIFRKVINLI